MPPPQPWIYINGAPGIGKLTIARELEKLLSRSQTLVETFDNNASKRTATRIIDNHLFIDLCRSVFEQGSPEYEALRSTIRHKIISSITSSPLGLQSTYIFTGSHSSGKLAAGTKPRNTAISSPLDPNLLVTPTTLAPFPGPGPLVARDFEQRAHAARVPFISIILFCDEKEHLRRATDVARSSVTGTRGKLTDIHTLMRIRQMEVYRFRCKYEMEMDITRMEPEEAARKILEFVNWVKMCIKKERESGEGLGV